MVYIERVLKDDPVVGGSCYELLLNSFADSGTFVISSELNFNFRFIFQSFSFEVLQSLEVMD